MCRASGEGGRRCPCAGPASRSAYRKAHRAAGHAATVGTTSPGNVGRPSTPELAELDTLEGRIALARRVSLAAGELTEANQDEWNEARFALVKEHGSVEQAATALGAVIAARSEELAGVTGKQVRDGLAQRQAAMIETFYALQVEIQGVRLQRDAVFTPEFRALEEMRVALRGLEGPERADALAQYEGAHEAHTQRWRQHPLNLRWSELSDQHMAIRTALGTGSDEESKAQLRCLADAYTQVLAQHRELGGQLAFHDKTTRKAAGVFGEAAQVFPTDWIKDSVSAGPVLAKIGKSRAHYSAGHTQVTRKRTQLTRRREVDRYDGGTEEDQVRQSYASDPRTQVGDHLEYDQDGQAFLTLSSFEVQRGYGPDNPPRGRGWESHHYVGRAGDASHVWRRPRNVMKNVSAERVPEITTAVRHQMMADRAPEFPTAVHELSHRFEGVQRSVGRLESDFLRRRTVDPQTLEREERTRLYPRARNPRMRMEAGYRDKLAAHYMGKTYPTMVWGTQEHDESEHYELVSCGNEALFGGRFGGLVGAHGDGETYHADQDMRAFILGTMACAGRSDADKDTVAAQISNRQEDHALVAAQP